MVPKTFFSDCIFLQDSKVPNPSQTFTLPTEFTIISYGSTHSDLSEGVALWCPAATVLFGHMHGGCYSSDTWLLDGQTDRQTRRPFTQSVSDVRREASDGSTNSVSAEFNWKTAKTWWVSVNSMSIPVGSGIELYTNKFHVQLTGTEIILLYPISNDCKLFELNTRKINQIAIS